MSPRTLTTLLLSLGLALGMQILTATTASALPGQIISKSRQSGPRTYKGTKGSGSSKSKKSTKSTSKSSASNRRVVRTTTSRTSAPSHTTATSRRTTTRTRPASGRTSSTRTVHRTQRPTSTHTRRTTRTTSSHRHLRGHNVRRTTYRSGHHSHGRTTTVSSHQTSRTGRTHGRSTIEPYVTGGLGVSGFASNDIVDGALPGLGYNLAVGAKGKLFGGEFGVNGGGYTLDTSNASTDIALIGLSGDLKLQPAISFFEPYIAVGLGGYAMQDAVIEESSAGLGLRLGAGADFRFDNIALRVHYLYGAYGLGNDHGSYNPDGRIGAKTETLGANLVVYF